MESNNVIDSFYILFTNLYYLLFSKWLDFIHNKRTTTINIEYILILPSIIDN
jgi:hypothetical protein